MRTSRRFQVRLSTPLVDQLQSFAVARGLRLAAAIPVLLAQSLYAEAEGRGDCTSALAALIAAEHAVLMVASVLPEGQRRMRELAPQAATAAEDRLRFVRDADQ